MFNLTFTKDGNLNIFENRKKRQRTRLYAFIKEDQKDQEEIDFDLNTLIILIL